jgi:hypothetical protein
MQLFGYLDILSFVGTSRLILIGQVNRTGSKTRGSELLENNPQVSRLRGRPKKRSWNYVQTDINNCKITNWKDRETELTGRSQLKRLKSTLDCSDIEEVEEY